MRNPVIRERGPLIRDIESGRINTVVLALPDMGGRLKGKQFHARHFVDTVIDHGAAFCGYLLATDVDMTPHDGYALSSWANGYPDMVARPDTNAMRELPWRPGTVLALADAFREEGDPVEVAPRHILTRQLRRLAEHGLRARVGFDAECVVFEGSYAHASDSDYRDLTPASGRNLDYDLSVPPRLDRLLRALRRRLDEAGLPVEAVKTEAGFGQVEVTLRHDEALAACDAHVVYKWIFKQLAAQARMAVTFMAQTPVGGSSGHIHLSLWHDDEPAMTNPDGQLSPLARQGIAGILDSLDQMGPFYAPYVNSYRRFREGSFAPTSLTWGVDNRTCAVRVVGTGREAHLEIRVPGADANPYLATAAVIAAILHGVETGPVLPDRVTGDAYQLRAHRLPASLADAVAAWRSSKLVAHAFGREVVEHYAHAAEIEWAHHENTVSDVELRRGFEHA